MLAKLFSRSWHGMAGRIRHSAAFRGLGIGPDRAGGLVSRRGHCGLPTNDVAAADKSLHGFRPPDDAANYH
jgi:hypothetical protein